MHSVWQSPHNFQTPPSLSQILLYVSHMFQLSSWCLEMGQTRSFMFDVLLTSPVVATWPVIPILTGNLISVLLLFNENRVWMLITNKLKQHSLEVNLNILKLFFLGQDFALLTISMVRIIAVCFLVFECHVINYLLSLACSSRAGEYWCTWPTLPRLQDNIHQYNLHIWLKLKSLLN